MEYARRPHLDRVVVAARPVNNRSRVSNGRDILPGIDGRSGLARRYRDIAAAILADQGGPECSEARQQLIRRFAACAVLAEQMEARLAEGEQISIERHATLCSTLTRLASRLGLERVAKDVTPTLGQILRNGIERDIERERPRRD